MLAHIGWVPVEETLLLGYGAGAFLVAAARLWTSKESARRR
jgi:hypothetical protein